MATDYVCPESTVESASRRSFLRNAALAGAAIGVGSTLASSSRLIPSSEAKSDCARLVTSCCTFFCGIGQLAVWYCAFSLQKHPCNCTVTCGIPKSAFLSASVRTIKSGCAYPLGAALLIRNTCSRTGSPVGVAGLTENLCYHCWPGNVPAGVVGSANLGHGVSGSSQSGTGVYATALAPSAVPLVAQGAAGQKANLQDWNKGGTNLSVVSSKGYFGIGTSTPSIQAQVAGTISGTKVGVGTSTPSATLQVSGSVAAKVVTKTSAYSMSDSDFGVLANASSGGFKVTLPRADTAGGMIVFVKKIDSTSNAVTLEGFGSGSTQDSIESSTSATLAAEYASMTLISNGASPPGKWFIISNGT
jgi:hypothetical protein